MMSMPGRDRASGGGVGSARTRPGVEAVLSPPARDPATEVAGWQLRSPPAGAVWPWPAVGTRSEPAGDGPGKVMAGARLGWAGLRPEARGPGVNVSRSGAARGDGGEYR